MDVYVNVLDQKLYVSGYPRKFVSGTSDFVNFIFTLNGDWEDLVVVAQFRQNGKAYSKYLDSDNSVTLPQGIVDGFCELSLYGTNGEIEATSETVIFRIDEDKFSMKEIKSDEDEGTYIQLTKMISSFISSYEEITDEEIDSLFI